MAKTSLKQIAYQEIKEKIINSEYASNSFMNEEFLCNDLQMSRTPIRDALGRLEQENLISIIPKKGFFILPLSIEEINMIYEGRMLLEPYIIRNYCQHLTGRAWNSLRKSLRSGRIPTIFAWTTFFMKKSSIKAKTAICSSSTTVFGIRTGVCVF